MRECDHPGRLHGKDGRPEPFGSISLRTRGAIHHCGQHRLREVPVHQGYRAAGLRRLGHRPPDPAGRSCRSRWQSGRALSAHLVAHLGPEYALCAGCQCGGVSSAPRPLPGTGAIAPTEVLALANEITPEPVTLRQGLNQLSGGQSRALMIADIALICDSPIVLIDEIENAGIDKAAGAGLASEAGQAGAGCHPRPPHSPDGPSGASYSGRRRSDRCGGAHCR